MATLGWTQEVEIQSFGHNGNLTWSGPSGSVCTVEWSGQLTPSPDWRHNWDGLEYIVMSNQTGAATVPMFYRVVCWTNAADLGWRLAKLEEDFDNNGTIDGVKRFSYDTDGNLTKEEEDENNDGTNDFAKYYIAAGDVLVTELGDDGYDGTINFATHNIYSNGLKVKVAYDWGYDGSTNKVNYRYYDASTNQIRSEWDDDNNSTIDSINYFFWNEAGHLVRTEHDEDANGSIDKINTNFWYDAAGNLRKTAEDENGDSVIDSAGYWTWEVGPKAQPVDFD